ncbi:MAG: hypothetical protein NTZ55_03655 [Candidatus Roizmanbacteria bacterium]|nr:hypothetical protein [Candidatus Roizmanbacteria bacterium]
MKFNIRLIYLYLFSFVGLIVFVIGCVRLVDLGLKVLVFNNADMYVSYPITPYKGSGDERTDAQIQLENEQQQKSQLEESKRNRQREISSSLAMIIVGAPLYLYHWSSIQKENKANKKKRG